MESKFMFFLEKWDIVSINTSTVVEWSWELISDLKTTSAPYCFAIVDISSSSVDTIILSNNPEEMAVVTTPPGGYYSYLIHYLLIYLIIY